MKLALTGTLLSALTLTCAAQAPPAPPQAKGSFIPPPIMQPAPSASPAPDYSAFTHSYMLPYAGRADFSSLNGLIHVNASINGGPVRSFVVDTGSVGIVVAADDVPNIDPNGKPDHIIYSSSGVEEDGVRTMATVTFPDAVDENGKPHPVEVHVQILAAQKSTCLHMGPNGENCVPSDHPRSHMMGVGFGRGALAADVANNPFVSLSEMLNGTMRTGYIIRPGGIQLGLTKKNAIGFTFQKLQPRAGIPDGGPKDWNTAPGEFDVNGVRVKGVSVLMDTGLTNMMMAAPDEKPGDVADGTPMTVYLPAGLSYSFKTSDKGVTTPRRVTWVPLSHGPYINTGLHALAQFDYLYDAEGGYLGLRAR